MIVAAALWVVRAMIYAAVFAGVMWALLARPSNQEPLLMRVATRLFGLRWPALRGSMRFWGHINEPRNDR